MSKLVPLSKGLATIVDDDDFARVTAFRWHVLRRGRLHHAMRSVRSKAARGTIYLHRWLLDAPAGFEVDHVNGDGLDNRRANLRLATHADNAINYRRTVQKTSRYHGVSWYPFRNRWRVVICAGDPVKQIHVGLFKDETEAACAYDRAAVEHHGAFAVTNFPREGA